MPQSIREQLMALAEPDYRDFSAKLLPDHVKLLGVRLPHLRRLAKEIAKDDWREYLSPASDEFFEEVMLQGMVIGAAKTDLSESFHLISSFLPKIDNWSVCDSFCASLKPLAHQPDPLLDFIIPHLSSQEEFSVRFALVMLLDYFITPFYLDKVFACVNGVKHPGYYVKMAAAWCISICYIRFPEETLSFWENCGLDSFTYQKSIQKSLESKRVTGERREILLRLREKIRQS